MNFGPCGLKSITFIFYNKINIEAKFYKNIDYLIFTNNLI